MNKTLFKLFLTNLFIILIFFFIVGVTAGSPSSDFLVFFLTGFLLTIILTLVVGRIFLRPLTQIKKSAAEHLNQISIELEHKTTALMEDQNELQTILSSMIEGVIVVNKDERIILINDPVYEMLDLRSQNTIGKPCWEVIRNDEINSLLKEAIHFKKSMKKEIAIIAPMESYFSTQVSCVLSNQQLSAVVAVFHDISELKKMARMRSEFVANASHELKTPLTTIKGFVETLKEGALNDPPRALQFLQIIDKHTARLEQLVNDLLSLSAIESKEADFKFERIPLETVIEAAVNFSKENIEKSRHKITVNLEENLPALFMDRSRMEQAFLNLLDNAIKFTPPGGGAIAISAKKEDDFIRVDVKDNGIGIDAAHLPRIFERFYRVDKGRSREMGGTGLGLSIVKHIVLAHHGKVSVFSQPQKGSTFSIFLPFRTPPTPPL